MRCHLQTLVSPTGDSNSAGERPKAEWAHELLTTDNYYRQVVPWRSWRSVVLNPGFLLLATRSKAQRVEATSCFESSPVTGMTADQYGCRILARHTDNSSLPCPVLGQAQMIVGESIDNHLRLLNRECGCACKRYKNCEAIPIDQDHNCPLFHSTQIWSFEMAKLLHWYHWMSPATVVAHELSGQTFKSASRIDSNFGGSCAHERISGVLIDGVRLFF